MNVDEIWDYVYENGLSGKQNQFNDLQRHLFYYIDFKTEVDFGGFLYNKSPSARDQNNYEPYINCWKFFGYERLASLVQRYNDLHVDANHKLGKGASMPSEEFHERFGLSELRNETENEIDIVVADIDKVLDWIKQNSIALSATDHGK